MPIFPVGGVPNNGVFTEPAIPTDGGCNGFYDASCLVALDVDALNAQIKEMTNITDGAGIPWDCNSLTNLHDAICAIAAQKACQEITDRHFSQTINGDSSASITLPAGNSWDVDVTLWATGSNQTLINAGDFVGVEIDDGQDSYLAFVADNFAGGHTFTASDINPEVSDNVQSFAMKVVATRVGDCS